MRGLFFTALLAAAGIIVYSGIENIRSSRDLRLLQQKVKSYEPFRMSDKEKLALYQITKQAVILERASGEKPPRLPFLDVSRSVG